MFASHSGHFHLSHDYRDSVNTKNGCVFAQVGVIGPDSSRDGLRQSRFVTVHPSNSTLDIYSINHHLEVDDAREKLRHDCTFNIEKGTLERFYSPIEDPPFLQTYTPRENDGCYSKFDDPLVDAISLSETPDVICWFHVGTNILGVHDGRMLEYDSLTYAPLGIVDVDLTDRDIVVVNDGQVLVLVSKINPSDIQVVQPNADGSFWKRYQANKKFRLEQKERENIARKIFGEASD